MNIQLIIVLLLFAASAAYLGRMLFRNLKADKGCGSGCKCGVDFSGIDQVKADK